MSSFAGTPPFLNQLWVAMENMHILIAKTGLCLDNFFRIIVVIINKLSSMKNCARVQGYLSWSPDYLDMVFKNLITNKISDV